MCATPVSSRDAETPLYGRALRGNAVGNPVAEYRPSHALGIAYVRCILLEGCTTRARQVSCVHPVTSLQTLVGIVEDGPTLKTSNLAGPLATPGQDVVNESLVCAIHVRTGAVGIPTGFLNHLGFHRLLHSFEAHRLPTLGEVI